MNARHNNRKMTIAPPESLDERVVPSGMVAAHQAAIREAIISMHTIEAPTVKALSTTGAGHIVLNHLGNHAANNLVATLKVTKAAPAKHASIAVHARTMKPTVAAAKPVATAAARLSTSLASTGAGTSVLNHLGNGGANNLVATLHLGRRAL